VGSRGSGTAGSVSTGTTRASRSERITSHDVALQFEGAVPAGVGSAGSGGGLSLVDGRQLSAAQPMSGVSARGGGFGAFLSQRILGAGSEAGAGDGGGDGDRDVGGASLDGGGAR
jgi:hypothetical protein